MPLTIEPADGAGSTCRSSGPAFDWLNLPIFGNAPLKPRDVAIMTRELATLLNAGLTVDQALQFLIDVASNATQQKLFQSVLERVQGGSTLADGLDDHRAAFSPAYVSMVRAGEAGNALPDVLSRLADYLERNEALRQRVRSNLVYPTLLLIIASLSIAVLLVVVRRFLQQHLEDAIPIVGTDQEGTDQPAFIGKAESLRLATSMPISLGQGLFLLDLTIRPSEDESGGRDLVLGWIEIAAELADDRAERMILDDVAGMTIAYYARSDEDPSGRWCPSWRGQDLLPELIRVDLQFPLGDRRRWQPLIVSPMVDEWYDTPGLYRRSPEPPA